MKSIRTRRANAQSEIDLGERSDRHGHGRMIVNTCQPFSELISRNLEGPPTRHTTSVISTRPED
jgi:hypothetical protein